MSDIVLAHVVSGSVPVTTANGSVGHDVTALGPFRPVWPTWACGSRTGFFLNLDFDTVFVLLTGQHVDFSSDELSHAGGFTWTLNVVHAISLDFPLGPCAATWFRWALSWRRRNHVVAWVQASVLFEASVHLRSLIRQVTLSVAHVHLTNFLRKARFLKVCAVSGFFVDLKCRANGTIFSGFSSPEVFEVHVLGLEFTDAKTLVPGSNEFGGFSPSFVTETDNVVRWALHVEYGVWRALLRASLSFELLSAGTRSWHVTLLWRQRTTNVNWARNFNLVQNLVSTNHSLFADRVTWVDVASAYKHGFGLRSARLLFNLNVWLLKPGLAFRTSDWPGAPLVPLVISFALLTATVFPGSGSDSVHVTGGQHVSVGRLLRGAGGPLWFVTVKLFGDDLFRESNGNHCDDFFDVLVSWPSSHVRVGLSKGATVLTGRSVVNAAGVTDPRSYFPSETGETLWSVFGELPFSGLAARVGASSFSGLVPFRLSNPRAWNISTNMNQRTRLFTLSTVRRTN